MQISDMGLKTKQKRGMKEMFEREWNIRIAANYIYRHLIHRNKAKHFVYYVYQLNLQHIDPSRQVCKFLTIFFYKVIFF